jgi:hypothetical protein
VQQPPDARPSPRHLAVSSAEVRHRYRPGAGRSRPVPHSLRSWLEGCGLQGFRADTRNCVGRVGRSVQCSGGWPGHVRRGAGTLPPRESHEPVSGPIASSVRTISHSISPSTIAQAIESPVMLRAHRRRTAQTTRGIARVLAGSLLPTRDPGIGGLPLSPQTPTARSERRRCRRRSRLPCARQAGPTDR